MQDKPLAAIRVLDLTRVLAGPWATQMLADFGAEVIKIERPGRGDDARAYGPPFLKKTDGSDDGETSAMYASANRNKKSVTVDISSQQGQALIRELAAKCDVLVENFKVGDLARYGLDYESLRALNPRLVYCSITGFGQTGPYRHRPGYDGIFQSMSGLANASGLPDDVPGGGPVKCGVSIADIIAGLYAYSAIATALYHRDQVSGKGQYIDIALLDTMLAAMSHHASTYLLTGKVPQRRLNAGGGGVPAQMFHCADGHIWITCGNDAQFRRLCQVIDAPQLGEDPRYLTNSLRVRNRDTLVPELDRRIGASRRQDLLPRLETAGVPAAPVNTIGEAFADPQVQERRNVVEVPHPTAGTMRIAANPVRFSETPIESYTAPPTLGQHTEWALRTLLGLDDERVRALGASGVI